MRLAQSKVHFIGIGGIGMSGLAELLFNMGAQVTGSDLARNANTEHLEKMGIPIELGHSASHVGSVDVVVYSSAVSANNPEIVEAINRKIPVIPRAEVLAEIMRLRRGIAIGGSHGKTTTTSLVASIFIHANLDPTIVVGGRLDLIKSTALLGQGEWLVAEADESDGSFLKLSPEMAIITNIDDDHLDFYKTFANLQQGFLEFARRIPFYGLAIIYGDDPRTRDLFKNHNKRILFYGFDGRNDIRLSRRRDGYEVYAGSQELGQFSLSVPGAHNALNALAAIAAGLEAGISFEQCAAGLKLFKGVDRRFDLKGEAGGVLVYDDYGHHPTEIEATLSAFREKYSEKRLVVVFQPHRYSRTQLCWQNFTTCFRQADKVLLWDIYPAGEEPLNGIHSSQLARQITEPPGKYMGHGQEALEMTLMEIKSGDLVVTLGAGDIWKWGIELLKRLESKKE